MTETRGLLRRFWHRRAGRWGLAVLGLLALVALTADFLAPYRPETQFRTSPNAPPALGRLHWTDETGWTGPYTCAWERARHPVTLETVFFEDCSRKYPLRWFVRGEPYRLFGLIPTEVHLFGSEGTPLFLWGTDRLGRDRFSRTLIGAQISLGLAAVVTAAGMLVGVALGGLSGARGGWLDLMLQRGVELTLALPRLALLLALAASLPSGLTPGIRLGALIALLAAVSWAPPAQALRTQLLSVREEAFVDAAHALGAGTLHVLRRHLLPNAAGTIVLAAAGALPSLLVLESVLSFFGFGVQEPLVSWGSLLREAHSVAELTQRPWVLVPGAFILVAVGAFHAVGDALRDATDPRTGRSAR